MRKKIVAGNWKMYTTTSAARQLAREVVAGVGNEQGVQVIVCPPFPYLGVVGEALQGSRVALGAQNAYCVREGAFTGEVSPAMLADVGCHYVILGHSERRHQLGESDELINKKVKLALDCGLKVILCVGETLQERESKQTSQVVERHLTTGIAGVAPAALAKVILAYEPVWAIGTGHTATPAQAQEVHAFLRSKVAALWSADGAAQMPILYGGSVKPANAAEIFQQPDVDGGLIGGASLKAADFLPIVQAGIG